MKIGIDTNVLIRWIVADESADHLDRIRRVFAHANLHLSPIAVAETIWVLSRTYRLSRQHVSAIMNSLLDLSNLTIGGADQLREALAEFEVHKGDLNDHLIAAYDRAAGCDYTLTFDRKARSKRFRLV